MLRASLDVAEVLEGVDGIYTKSILPVEDLVVFVSETGSRCNLRAHVRCAPPLELQAFQSRVVDAPTNYDVTKSV